MVIEMECKSEQISEIKSEMKSNKTSINDTLTRAFSTFGRYTAETAETIPFKSDNEKQDHLNELLNAEYWRSRAIEQSRHYVYR